MTPYYLATLALWAFLVWTHGRKRRLGTTAHGESDGQPWTRISHAPRRGKPTVTLGLPLRIPVRFELHQERWTDALFKWVRVSRESQTFDPAFDDEVYVACDHPGFTQLLQRDRDLRRLVQDLLISGVDEIWGDGESVWIRRDGTTVEQARDLSRLAELAQRLAPLKGAAGHRARDDSPGRAWLVTTLAHGVAAAGIVCLFYWGRKPTPWELNAWELVPVAVRVGLGGLATFAVLGLVLLGGSSRGHRTLLGAIGLALVSSPFAALQLTSELNRRLDASAPEVVVCDVVDKVRLPGSKGTTSYKLWTRRCEGGPALPNPLTIDRALFESVSAGGQMQAHVHPGALGVRWTSWRAAR